jgi:hypothetical protein
MKAYAKTLACAVVASSLLLACNDTGTNAGNPIVNCKIQPTPASVTEDGNTIATDVKEWMVSGDKEKRKVYIYDMYRPQIDMEMPTEMGRYNSSTGEETYECYIAGQQVTEEKCAAHKEEYNKKLKEAEKERESTLQYSGEVEITAEELSRFLENNKELSVRFSSEMVNDGSKGEVEPTSPCS